MELDSERVLKLIFPDGVPENLEDNVEVYNYLAALGNYKVEQLKKEEARLEEETKRVVEQIQDLAVSNYKTFIQTAENTRFIYKEFEKTETQVSDLLDKLPVCIEKCEEFKTQSAEINEQRSLNSLTLKKHNVLLEILEIPQLMEHCIREGCYEEALELASYVQKISQNHADIPILQNILHSVDSLWHTMLVQLVAQLRTDLQLPKCLQIVGFLRRMEAFDNSELRLKFLQTRDAWFLSTLKDIPKHDAQQHLTKTIEVTRINLFNIITQYRAIFPDTPDNQLPATSVAKEVEGLVSDGQQLFYAWLHDKIDDFLKTLEADLDRGVNSMEAVLDQCMYFGLSFSRVGADFRALMVPIFLKVISRNFNKAIEQANETFAKELEKYTLINKVALPTRIKTTTDTMSTAADADMNCLTPAESLMDFLPLAILCNAYMTAFNDLRLCTPIALASEVTKTLQKSLEFAAAKVFIFYKQEQQAFSGNEQEIFIKLCSCFAYDFIPFIQRCIHALFPQQQLTTLLGINLQKLENSAITYLNTQAILAPLQHLLPQKIEVMEPEKILQETVNPVEITQ